MSYLIVRCLCPNYEDYDPLGMERNAVQGFPDLWEPERYAEGALYEQHKAMMEQVAMLGRYYQAHPQPPSDSNIVARALVSIAKENNWQVQNAELVERCHVTTVYTIPPVNEDEPMPYRWNDMIRWLDRQKTKEEDEAIAAKKKKEELEAKRRRDNNIVIDCAALVDLMKDLMPDLVIEGNNVKFARTKSRKELQTLVCAQLARERGWIRNDPHEYNWRYREIPIKIYKT